VVDAFVIAKRIVKAQGYWVTPQFLPRNPPDMVFAPYGLSLLIYALAERKVRQALKEMGTTIPDQR